MAETDQILKLAAIIRKVDGNHSKGAAALAESILDHPDFRAALGEVDEPAVPEGREPVAVIGEPSDRRPTVMEIIELSSKIEAAELGQVDFARAVLARWGNPAPQPPAEGEVAECTAELEEQKPRPDYDRVQKIATEAQIRSAAQYLAKKQHCDGDLIPAIRYAIARWGNPAPQPPAEGEVAELVEGLRLISDGMSAIGHDSDSWFVARAAELLQRLSPPQPVPVSERLPAMVTDGLRVAGDCDEQGRCWAGTRAFVDTSGDRDIDYPPSWELREVCAQDDVWLPAHALPIPQQQENTDD